MKKFVALARVSSREQEREGFSLDVQVDALTSYAKRQSGTIVQMFRIAETASKQDERKTFKEMLRYVRKNAERLDGLLFYKVDRAARNLFDYMELERLEIDYGIRAIFVSQPTENSPAGRMQRRMLATMASHYTEQQSKDVQEGQARRVQSGLFVGHAPYGYKNIRVDGRGQIEIDSEYGPKVQRIFELYAHHGHTIDSLIAKMEEDGVMYLRSVPKFTRSKVHSILRDRAYIGDVHYQNQWHPGKHTPLIDRNTWDRVQVLLGEKIYHSHEMAFAGEFIKCGHCGAPITGELKLKKTKSGEKAYIYYRCSKYNKPGHPRIRLTEAELDSQMLALFDTLRIPDEEVRDWFRDVLRAKTKFVQQESAEKLTELQRQHSSIQQQQEKLLNMRLADEIDGEVFSRKSVELRDRAARLVLKIEGNNRQGNEYEDVAVKTFELSQSLRERWVTADCAIKRQILETLCLNCTLENTNLVATLRSPFEVLRKYPVEKIGRGDRI
jgi:site-specific DNA recombinase